MFMPPKHEVLIIDAPGVQDCKARKRDRGKREARIEKYINKYQKFEGTIQIAQEGGEVTRLCGREEQQPPVRKYQE